MMTFGCVINDLENIINVMIPSQIELFSTFDKLKKIIKSVFSVNSMVTPQLFVLQHRKISLSILQHSFSEPNLPKLN